MNQTVLESLETLKHLIAIPSVQGDPMPGAPFGKENAEALNYTLETFEKLGFKTVNLDGYCGWAEIGEGELFGILGHLDVVPISGEWRYPPFSATIAEGCLWGRGTQDDKGPMIAASYAVVRLLREGYKPTKRIRLIFGCNEESGWGCMDHYCAHAELPAIGFSPDADFPVINCEKGVVYHTIRIPRPAWLTSLSAGTRPNMVPDLASVSVVAGSDADKALSQRFQKEGDAYISRGVSAHGSTPDQGVNALLPLLKALPDQAIARIASALEHTDGSGANLALFDKQSGALTMNLGTAATEGDDLVFQLDIRHPVTYTKEQITELLRAALPDAEITQGSFHLPLYVAPDHPLVTTLLDAYRSVTGTEAQPITIGGGTYARVLPLGVAFGPIFPDETSTIHQANERISLDNYERCSEIYYRAIKALCFQ